MDMIWIAYFFLLRPGEYVKTRDNSPLTARDVTFMVQSHKLDPYTCPLHDFSRVTHVTLTFDDQKNRNRGETIGHARSGHPHACPVQALIRRMLHLRQHNAPNHTPLCTYYLDADAARTLDNKQLAAILSVAANALPALNYQPKDISPRSLRSGGAMALLCGNVDTDVIKLVGRWKSDAIFRYLHAQALPIVSNLARTMVHHGAYRLLPGNHIPPAAQPILQAEAAQIAHLAAAWTAPPV